MMLINGVPVGGFDDSDAFKFEPDEDNYEYATGADGEGTRSRIINHSGMATFSLKQTSPSNAIFGSFQALGDRGLNDTFNLRVVNLDSGEEVSAAVAWVQRKADLNMNKAAGVNTWPVKSARFVVNHGAGNIPGLF